jgi:hypothetical protein
MSRKDEQMTYFENMSRATASLAIVNTKVMHRKIWDYPTTSIWGRIEKKEIQSTSSGGRCNLASLSVS